MNKLEIANKIGFVQGVLCTIDRSQDTDALVDSIQALDYIYNEICGEEEPQTDCGWK